MDEWESVRKKIKQMEGSLLGSSPEARNTVDDVSVADFWKKRYEEEKQLWEEKLAAKEKEQSRIKDKFMADEEGIRELNFKVKLLELKLESEKLIWEERSKSKVLEAEAEKKRLEWEARGKVLEEENSNLRGRIRSGSELTEDEIKRREHLETEKTRMEEELRALHEQLQNTTIEDQKKLEHLETEKQIALKQLEDLQAARRVGEKEHKEVERELTLLAEERDHTLARLAQREKEQFESFEELTRGFAHKVRNHLGIMSGTLQLCAANFKMDEELRKQLALVDQNAQDMLKAIEEFLALAKTPEMNIEMANTNEFLTNAVFSVEELARSQNIVIEKKFADGVPAVPMDPKLMIEAVKQILLNAIEASPSGGTVSVTSTYDDHPRRVIIRVADSGKGISENHLKKIFQPYFTTRKGKKGLGLCVAKHAIDLHHGSLVINSPKDRGTTVTVLLPAQKIK